MDFDTKDSIYKAELLNTAFWNIIKDFKEKSILEDKAHRFSNIL